MKVACSVSSLRRRCSHGLIDDYALVFLWNLPQMCCAKRKFSDGRSGATTRRAELTSMTTNPIKHSDSTNTAVGPIRCTVNTGGGPLGARAGSVASTGERAAHQPRRVVCHQPQKVATPPLQPRAGRSARVKVGSTCPSGRARPAGRGQPLARRARAHGLKRKGQLRAYHRRAGALSRRRPPPAKAPPQLSVCASPLPRPKTPAGRRAGLRAA